MATLMIQIDEPGRRAATLLKLGGIEASVYMAVGASRISATPTDYEDRTTPEGKTSSVHWVRFRFTPDQIALFKNPNEIVILGLTHPNYGHMAVVPPGTGAEVAKVFD